MYQVLDAVLLRASAHPARPDLPAWPELTGDVSAGPVGDWLTAVWAHTAVAEAVTVASPALADQVTRIRDGHCHDPRQLRRTVASLTRYLLRTTGRATPFALFAGVAPVACGADPAVRWGHEHRAVTRADGGWLSAVTTALEQCPALLRRLPVVLNDLADVRDDRVVLPYQPPTDPDDRRDQAPRVVDVTVRCTAFVAAVVAYARTPVVVEDLLDTLRGDFPTGPAPAAVSAIGRLVSQRVLLSVLRPPMTTTDGLRHLLDQLTAVGAGTVPEVADTVRALHAIAEQIRAATDEPSTDARLARRRALTGRMEDLAAGPGRPLAVDLRLDADIVLPDTAAGHARDAAALLTRLTPYPHGLPAWQDYHAAFLERYGVGAVVPVRDVTDPDIGLGMPATYRGSHRTIPAAPVSDRDRELLRLVQHATIDSGDEIVLDEDTITRLVGPDGPRLQVPPHVEVIVQIHADSPAALRQDRYTMVVSGAARAAGATTGRFLHLLTTDDRERFRHAYSTVSTTRPGAVPAQLSFPPLQASSDHLACAPPMLPTMLSAGGYTDDDRAVRVGDLAVSGDTDGLFLMSTRDGRIIEPTVLHAVEFRYFSHPLARFLCELPRARTAVYMPFAWGAAAGLPFLPRVRHRRTVLVAARWNLATRDLPPADTSWHRWQQALNGWRTRMRVPDRVYLVEADNLLPLDLTEPTHQHLLRAHLARHGHARLDEAPHPDAYRWLHGHAHEFTIPLTATPPATPPATATRPATPTPPTVRAHVAGRDDAHLPGAGPWLYAKLYASPAATIDLVHHIPELLADWDNHLDWWYLPYRDPDPHLRLRIRLPHAGGYGPAAARVGAWTDRLRHRRLLGRVQLDTYHPETGRYGHGPAMTAAEHVFAHDSTAAIAELATAGTVPIHALAAASLTDIAAAFTGDTDTGMRWLITHLPHEPGQTPRTLHTAAVRLADPRDDRAALRAADPTDTVLPAWHRRRLALAAYRDHLATQRDPLPVLASLLHLHSIRLHGVDPDRERQDRSLARAAAQRWTALHHPDTP